MSVIRVSRCNSPIKTEGINRPIISQKTTTVVCRASKRTDLDMDAQVQQVKAEKLQQRAQWLQGLTPAPTTEYQIQSIKYAVAESILFHHNNGSMVLCGMLDTEADKKGTNGNIKNAKKIVTCCGLPKHYLTVLMDDIELITKLDGAHVALTSIRALPLWKLGHQQQ